MEGNSLRRELGIVALLEEATQAGKQEAEEEAAPVIANLENTNKVLAEQLSEIERKQESQRKAARTPS